MGRKAMLAAAVVMLAGCGTAVTVASAPTVPQAAAPAGTLPPTTIASTTFTTSDGLTDNGWSVIPGTFTQGPNSLGNFVGSAEVRNDQTTPAGTALTFKIYSGDVEVAELTGQITPVAPGQTVQALLSSNIRYAPGDYTYTFAAG